MHISFGKKYIDHWMKEQEDILPKFKPLHKKGSKYTMADLKENSRKYDENFKMMMKTVGTSEHDKYVKIERELNKLDIKIRDNLNILIKETPEYKTPEYKIEINKTKEDDDFFSDKEEEDGKDRAS